MSVAFWGSVIGGMVSFPTSQYVPLELNVEKNKEKIKDNQLLLVKGEHYYEDYQRVTEDLRRFHPKVSKNDRTFPKISHHYIDNSS